MTPASTSADQAGVGLRELEAAATPGDWSVAEGSAEDGSIYIDADDTGMYPVAMILSGSPHNQDRADAAFIVAAVAHVRAALATPPAAAETVGAGVMREAAAKVADDMATEASKTAASAHLRAFWEPNGAKLSQVYRDRADAYRFVAAAIRALPLPANPADHARPGRECEALEAAMERIGWPEIHAFQNELRKGQDVYEDAGGYFLRAIKALFGLKPRDPVLTYRAAAQALIDAALLASPTDADAGEGK